jgi:rhamnose utilization protein RhaD (predicted bifunctional aldolase and dehydrogenase)
MDVNRILNDIAALSRDYGANPEYVLAGGGNTSAKSKDTIWIKGSGTALATLKIEDLVALDRAKVKASLAAPHNEDPFRREAEIVADLLAARREPSRGQRPSVETMLHDLLDRTFVVHLHPPKVLGLVCARDAETRLRAIFGHRVHWLPYVDPGYQLRRAVAGLLKDAPAIPGPILLFLQNHGVFVAADTADEIRAAFRDIGAALDAHFDAAKATERFPAPPARAAPARRHRMMRSRQIVSPGM